MLCFFTWVNPLTLEKKATYLIYQYFQSVQCCRWRVGPILIDTCRSRLIVSCQLLSIHSLNLQLIRTFFIIKNGSFWSVLVVMCSQPFSLSLRWWILHARNVQYLPWTTRADIDLKWRHSPRACLLRYQSAYFPVLFRKSRPSCHFRTLTAYNKKTKTNFQKLISKPFSTCLNLSNKLNLWKRCSWPLR